MLKPERMSKLFVMGPKSQLNDAVSKLHELKVAHIVEHVKEEYDLCDPLECFEKVSSMLVQVRSLISYANIKGEGKNKQFKIYELEKEISRIREEFSKISDDIKNKEDQISLVQHQQNVLKLMSYLEASPEDFQPSNYVKSYLGYVSGRGIKERISRITDRSEVRTAETGKSIAAAVFIDSKKAGEAEKVLAEHSSSEVEVSVVRDLSGSIVDLFEELSKKKIELERNLRGDREKLEKLVSKYSSFLLDAEKFLAGEAERAQAPLSFGATKETFFLRCYLPSKDTQRVKKKLNEATNNRIYFEEEKVANEDEIPVKLRNPKPVKSFEFFTNIFSLPKYNEFDPTSLTAFTFPIFFGFMLGDVAYGAITFVLFYFLKKKFPAGKEFFNILMVASVSAMVFGVLYGEVLGHEPWHGLIVRTHDFNTLMIISIIAGAVHVNLGLALGFILSYNHHGFLHASYEKLSWILLQLSGVLLYLSYSNTLNLTPFAGYLLLAISVFMLYKAEGFMGIIEIPSIVSHIVSYARLMAVGLASVFIAVLVNDLTTFLFHKSILMAPLALVALVVGHSFNIALGILSPSLHSIRLHYVEFYTKFFQGGGIEYSPFGREKPQSIL